MNEKSKFSVKAREFLKEKRGSIIFLVVVVAVLLWAYLNVNKAMGNAITYSTEYEAPEGNVDFEDPGTYVSVAKTDRLEMLFNEAKGAIQVKDLASGHVWKSICDQEVYDVASLNGQWAAYLQSPITISYNDLSKRDSGVVKAYSGRDANILEHKLIDNGVAVTYGFATPGIFVTIEYVLDGDHMDVRLPVENIEERANFAVQTVELLPFFGAAMNDVGGYLFYPDGSGAITTYERSSLRPSNVKVATYYIYTNRSLTFMNLFNDDSFERYTVSMPVYGIKDGDAALFAIFTKGAENAGIVVAPSGYVVDLNHMGFEIYTRNVYNVNLNAMSTSTGTAGGTVQRLDKQLIPEDREVQFYFLNGDQADYGGMADVYRDYLLQNGMLNDAYEEDDKQMSLALDLLMGTTKEGMIFDEYIPMTDFDEAAEIMGSLENEGITDMNVVLRAWQKDYDEYEYWGPARQLGGTGGLEDINRYMREHTGTDIYLESDMMFATSNTSGLNEEKDVVYDGLDLEVSAEQMNGDVFYLLNPQAAFDRNTKFLDKLKGYDQLGVAYYDVGKYAFADFNEDAPFTKTQTANKLRDILASADAAGRKVGSAGANQYVLGYADYMYDLREDCYGLAITDYGVPFLQMVISGMIPYCTEGAGNLSYDLQVQKLKWIEYGAIPYFYLTYEPALNLRDTGYDNLFSSTFQDWESVVVETYNEFRDNLSDVYGQQIVDHRIITEDLIRIEYANGIAVYINYGPTDAQADGVTVPAKNYTVVRGGGQ